MKMNVTKVELYKSEPYSVYTNKGMHTYRVTYWYESELKNGDAPTFCTYLTARDELDALMVFNKGN